MLLRAQEAQINGTEAYQEKQAPAVNKLETEMKLLRSKSEQLMIGPLMNKGKPEKFVPIAT